MQARWKQIKKSFNSNVAVFKPLKVYWNEEHVFFPVMGDYLFILVRKPFEQACIDCMRMNGPRFHPHYHEVIVSRYEYRLFMDLWVVKLKLRWEGRENAEVKALRAR